MRVLLLEDEGLLRSSLAAALRQQGLQVAGACAEAGVAVRLARAERPDALVADIDLGAGPTGIDAAAAMRRFLPQLGVVVLTSYSDPRLAGSSHQAIPAGTEYLIKTRVTDAGHVARAVLRSVALAGSGGVAAGSAAEPLAADLTDQQVATLRLLAAGLTNAQIAAAQGVTEKSVEHAIARLARRLGLDAEPGTNTRVLLARRYFVMSGSAGPDAAP